MKSNPSPSVANSPRGLPPAAPISRLLQTAACRTRPIESLDWCRRRLGPRFTVHPIDMPPLVFLTDPSDIREIITAPLTVLHAGRGAALTAPLFGTGSFLLRDEDDYLSGRNAIAPAFAHTQVTAHTQMVADLASREIASWPLDAAFPAHPRLRSLTLRIILRSVLSDEDSTVATLHDHLLAMLSVAASLVLQEPRLCHLPGWRGTWKLFIKERAIVDKLIATIIARRRNEPSGQSDTLNGLLAARRPDGSPMTDSELRDNLVSVITAGHETTAATLAWAFQLLAHHPSAQDRLAAEIAEHRDEYLLATINEVLRHRPVFLFTAPRAVAKPIDINGWTYYPPTHLLGCTYLMHHDPKLYARPHEFLPERFLKPPPPKAWLPWGGGPKLCPGRHLALLELRTVLQTTLATRRLLPASARFEHAQWRSALVTPHAGSKIVLRKRHRRAPFADSAGSSPAAI
jgi:cytochrome P450